MNKHNQNGSALAVITVILAIALVGALGFIFWQKLTATDSATTVQNTSSNASNTSPETPTIKTKTGSIDSKFPAGLSWTYPENWSMRSEGTGPAQPTDMADQKIILTSPNSKYEVIYHVGINGGLGGACVPDGSTTLRYIERTPVPNFSKLVFTEAITETTEGFKYDSKLFQNSEAVKNTKPGDSSCNIYLHDVVPLTADGNMVILGAEINIKKFDSSNQYGPTEIYPREISPLKEAFNDPEYKDAVKILLSTVSN